MTSIQFLPTTGIPCPTCEAPCKRLIANDLTGGVRTFLDVAWCTPCQGAMTLFEYHGPDDDFNPCATGFYDCSGHGPNARCHS